MMKAMVFAAGLGTRLRPFTLTHPKALVPVCGVPMLERVVAKLKGYGVDDVTVNVHHYADQIVDYVRERDNFGIHVGISDETARLLDTGGGILWAIDSLRGDGPVIVHNADILTDCDIPDMLRWHEASGNDVTLLVSDRVTTRYLLFDHNNIMRGWTNIQTGTVRPEGLDTAGLRRLAFGGVHILSQRALEALEGYRRRGDVFSVIDYYVDMCGELRIGGYEPVPPYYWHDIGKPNALAEAENTLKQQ